MKKSPQDIERNERIWERTESQTDREREIEREESDKDIQRERERGKKI